MCDICVRNIEEKILTLDSQYQIDVCLLCRKDRLIIELKLLIAELRVLNVDGDSTREIIAIDILNLLQDILENI